MQALRAAIVLLLFGAALLALKPGRGYAETGIASWYGAESGSRRADGKRFDPEDIVCAHRSLPFGTMVLVTDLKSGRRIRCPIRDRGPARWTGRIIDLSKAAARALGILKRGTARVRLERVW